MADRVKLNYKIEPLNLEVDEKWKRAFDYVQVVKGSERITVLENVANHVEDIYNFKVRPDDVWVTTFSRSGTALTQEMIWMILNDDYETARKVPLTRRVPFFEVFAMVPDEQAEALRKTLSDETLEFFNEIVTPPWDLYENSQKRRFFKTHLQYSLLPPSLLTSGCKVLYVARNPKDVAVSYFKYIYYNLPDEDFADFWKIFQNGYVENTPYWEHIIAGWNQRNNKNVCFMFFEDIVKDLKAAIKKVSAFLEKDMTEEQIDKLAEHLKIENVQKNESITNHYHDFIPNRPPEMFRVVRKGKVGGYRDYFNSEVNAIANKWIEENYQKTDLRFPIDLLD